MRPKLFSLLAVSAIALVGCSAAETPTDPAPSMAQVSATPEAQPTPTISPEDKYMASLDEQLGDLVPSLKKSGVPKKKLNEQYWLERGKAYCAKDHSKRPKYPSHENTINTTDQGLELTLLGTAQINLCPDDI